MIGPQLIWIVILAPLLGAAVQSLLGARLSASRPGRAALGFLGVFPIALAFTIAVPITLGLTGSKPIVVGGPDWIVAPGLRLPFEWIVDPLSMTMVLVITGIGALIHLYSTGYMSEERDFGRFFAYLNLFVAAMLVLVLGNNLPLLFVGWEGVGLCSYLLIGFWYRDGANVAAGNKAFVVNRIGDWSLMLGMFLLFCLVLKDDGGGGDARRLSYDVMLPRLGEILAAQPTMATIAALLLFGGAAGKSAQFPLYLWLPDAMAGPTPVSALIHAATMVTSGVVLLNRMQVVFQASPTASLVVAAIGAFTALFAALIALSQTDIKKVLAYSTVSQLGFMFIGCGAGAYWTGMFHVVTHAFFKALLFLGAGAVIHAMAHDQDMRNYGKLGKYLPITMATMAMGWLAISAVGIPHVFGFAGFYSKESIIGAAFESPALGAYGPIIGYTALFVAVLTAFYMTRLMLLTFFGGRENWRSLPVAHHDDDGHREVLDANHKPHEVGLSMSIPLIVLAVLSVAGGFLLQSRFEGFLQSQPLSAVRDVATETERVPLGLYSMIAAFGGIALGFLAYLRGFPAREADEARWSPFRRASSQGFGVDGLLSGLATEGGGDFGRGLYRWFDVGILDGVIGGFGRIAEGGGAVLRTAQRGYVRVYAFMMLLGVVGFVGWFVMTAARGGR